MAERSAPVSFKELVVDETQIGSYQSGNFALNDRFYRQQLAIPAQLQQVPNGVPSFGRQNVSNKSLPDTGPSEALATEWDTNDIASVPTGAERLNVERFFDADTHTNDAEYAIANSYMPAPAVQHYGLSNEEYYPIWGMNDNAVQNLSGYPNDAASTWRIDGQPMVQNASSELENNKRGVFDASGPIGQTRYRNYVAYPMSMESVHRNAAAAHAPGAPLPENALGRVDLSHLPGGVQADKTSMSYHDVYGIRESPYAYRDDELVHNTVLDVRLGNNVQSDNLAVPAVPFTTAGHDEALSRF
jgi:hypothetical protein